jgi:hypothetical protein
MAVCGARPEIRQSMAAWLRRHRWIRRSIATDFHAETLGYIQGTSIAVIRSIVLPDAKVIELAITRLLPEIDILVAWGTIGGAAAKRVTPSMPTVFLSVGAPVDIGLVQSLSRNRRSAHLYKFKNDRRAFSRPPPTKLPCVSGNTLEGKRDVPFNQGRFRF